MKISTKGRYALRLMLDLAINHTGNYIPLKTVAQRQNISDKYLEQIIHQLSKAGFVQSARGAQGAIVWRARLMNTLSVKFCAQSRAVLLPYPAWTAKHPAISLTPVSPSVFTKKFSRPLTA